jgi:hypothetical protein
MGPGRQGGGHRGRLQAWRLALDNDYRNEVVSRAINGIVEQGGGLLLGFAYGIFAALLAHFGEDPIADIMNNLQKYMMSRTLNAARMAELGALGRQHPSGHSSAQGPAQQGRLGNR